MKLKLLTFTKSFLVFTKRRKEQRVFERLHEMDKLENRTEMDCVSSSVFSLKIMVFLSRGRKGYIEMVKRIERTLVLTSME